MARDFTDANSFFSRFDMEAIEDVGSKVAECEYFLGLASNETNRSYFRWLVSAFLNAAYGYFEMSALHAYFAFTDQDGNSFPDDGAIAVLRGHVRVMRNEKRPDFVKTAGLSTLTKKLYEIRKGNTHHFPLAIMIAGPDLPGDFQFGTMRGKGEPVIPFCRDVMRLIHSMQQELNT
jgi:hypothetical protein